MDGDLDLKYKLEDLGRRIDAKAAEIAAQGLLHGPARQKAAELQVQRARILNRLDHAKRIDHVLASELATDVEILKHNLERWLAHTDRLSERR